MEVNDEFEVKKVYPNASIWKLFMPYYQVISTCPLGETIGIGDTEADAWQSAYTKIQQSKTKQ